MEVLAITNLVLAGIVALSSIPMIVFLTNPEGWENSTNKFKKFVHEAGPYSVLVMLVGVLIFLLLSLVLSIVVLV